MSRYASVRSPMAQKPAKVCPLCGLRYDPAAAFCQKDGARLTAEGAVDPFLGKVILGQFRVDESIGAGGMGTVYRAHQLNLHRDVAVKILHPELLQNPDAVRRFHREAKVATSLEHPNLVRVFLFGELEDNAGLYLVMEHLEGRSLTELMRQEGALPPERALHLGVQLCHAIGAAHAQGIVHRDVKPENIIIVPRHGDPDFVKVLDFGIARLLWDEQSQMTQTGVIFGTARYISPEGAAGEFTDARSDVYSIGVLLYQLLAGVTPFDAATPVSMLMKHINERAPHIREHKTGIPTPVADVVMRALAKNPDARYENATALGEALTEAAKVSGLATPSPRFSLAPGDSFAGQPAMQASAHGTTPAPYTATPQPHTSMTIPGMRKRRWPRMVGLFLVGLLAVLGGVWAAEVWLSASESEQLLEANLNRAQEALAAGHFERPPGDNVAELTLRILETHPRHERALSLRREAAALLRAQGAGHESEGDIAAARAAYRSALVFAPTDAQAMDALAALDTEPAANDQAGLRLAPAEGRAGSRVTFLGIVDHRAEVQGETRFEVRSRGRVVANVRGEEASDHHYVGSYVFRRAGTYEIRFTANTDGGEVTFTSELPIMSRTAGRNRQPRVDRPGAGQATRPNLPPPSDTPGPLVPGNPGGATPAPDPIPTADDGIDWTVPSDMSGAAPPPWTGDGNVI